MSLSVDSRTDLLLVIDVQNDFCEGGALAVPQGDQVVGPINHYLSRFDRVVLTQDWHPPGHSSFASSHPGQPAFGQIAMPYGPQTLWPDHCVQGTPGAQFHPQLHTSAAQAIVRKGQNPALDSYSAALENDHSSPTGLIGYLRELGIERVFCCGLATDFCVRFSAEDLHAAGFAVSVLDDACRAIDMDGSGAAAYASFAERGIAVIGGPTATHR